MLRDEVYLLDIADSAKAALAYVSGKTREQFFSDRQPGRGNPSLGDCRRGGEESVAGRTVATFRPAIAGDGIDAEPDDPRV